MRDSFRQSRKMPAAIFLNDQRMMGQIEDVSEGGMSLRARLAAPVGTELSIHALGAKLDAELRWSKDGRMGVRFLDRNNSGDLQRFIVKVLHKNALTNRSRVHGFTEMAGRPKA
jgi:hypothetical protein